MSEAMRVRFRLWIIWTLIVGVVVAGGIYFVNKVLLDGGSEGDGKTKAAATIAGPSSTAAPSGQSRLREGARQVVDPVAARATAREALVRVEAELATASDPAEVERLARKKGMIRQAMERFDEAQGD